MMPARRWLDRLRIGTPALAALLLVFGGVHTWNDAVATARTETRAGVDLLSSQVGGIAKAQFVMHDAIEVRMKEAGTAGLRSEQFHLFLRDLQSKVPRSYGIGVLGLDGRLLASSAEFPTNAVIGPRTYLTMLAAGQTRVIDRRDLEATGVDALVSATAVTLGSERYAIVNAWRVDEASDFINELARHTGHRASLVRDDGTILVSTALPHAAKIPFDHPMMKELHEHRDGMTVSNGLVGNDKWLVAYTAVRDAPIFAVYSVSYRSILVGWARDVAPLGVLTAFAGLFGFIFFGMLRATMESQLRNIAAIEQAEAAEKLARHHATLVKEMNHRIKNNLAMVSSIIRFDARRNGGLDARDVANRLQAVASMHDMLYLADDGTTADLKHLLEVITTNPAIVPPELQISVQLGIDRSISLPSKLAVNLSMIVVEIITNAVKYAFERTPHPILSFYLGDDPERIELIIKDNGQGFIHGKGKPSGSTLVSTLASSADISVMVEEDHGVRYRLGFPQELLAETEVAIKRASSMTIVRADASCRGVLRQR